MSDSALRAALVQEPDFAIAYVSNLVSRLNLFMNAYADLRNMLVDNVAMLSSEQKQILHSILTTVLRADAFFSEIANAELQRLGVLPDGDALANELENMLKIINTNKED